MKKTTLREKLINKKERDLTPKTGFGQMIQDWILAVEKKLRNK